MIFQGNELMIFQGKQYGARLTNIGFYTCWDEHRGVA